MDIQGRPTDIYTLTLFDLGNNLDKNLHLQQNKVFLYQFT